MLRGRKIPLRKVISYINCCILFDVYMYIKRFSLLYTTSVVIFIGKNGPQNEITKKSTILSEKNKRTNRNKMQNRFARYRNAIVF